jgi:hypothetical protein
MTTLDRAYPKDDTLLKLKVSLDNALLEIFSNPKNSLPKIRNTTYN